MATFSTDTALMRTKSAQVLATAERVRSEVSSMHASLQDLSGSWSGAASQQFQGLITQWRQVQSKVEESLAQISRALSSASTQYDEVERANASLFSS
ncbi:WXG100 family type VII secretion target [Galactobacter valiniphilus]|uniref:ESAT-6-like protein n=1 Tax=Galactobacter valiniphilus TaxID=2676122 RepID=A0A399J9W8_9MICC|nr:WXG100 family type VII secretion target [Galactobacter valiniphilus]RII42373.1 WXG100 family type VII secretion target [Galactobacter valiniphilus]